MENYEPNRLRIFLIWVCAKFRFLTPFVGWLTTLVERHKGTETVRALPPFGTDRFSTSYLLDASDASINWDILERPPNTKRSMIFSSHCYYHFYYLAAALRKRGWHAISANWEDPSQPNNMYYHGEDINLHSDDSCQKYANIHRFFDSIVRNFDLVHFHGESVMCLFPQNQQNIQKDLMPWEFLELKRQGLKIGFSISGCLTGQPQTEFNQLTGGVCDKCVWQGTPSVCSDNINIAAAKRLDWICDLIACEGDWVTSYRDLPQSYKEPLTFCLNTDLWRPDLEVPKQHLIPRKPDEILILHAVGNYNERNKNGRNIKGTRFVVEAVEKLQSLGYPVRLIFKTGIPSVNMKYIQAQADIVVDQLNYGRFGATSRECLALGKPVITNCRPYQRDGSLLKSVAEAPVVHADEQTIFEELKSLCDDKSKCSDLSKRSRDYALKWFDSELCAERYEIVFDAIMRGERVSEL